MARARKKSPAKPAQKTDLKVRSTTKEKILDAALRVIRTKGYASTTVDDLCSEAQITKGAFFHYFASKEDLAVAAAGYWSEITARLFANADYHKASDPLERILAYIDFRKELLRGEIAEFTCLVGTMVQEAYSSHAAIRDACHASIFGHAQTLEKDITHAKRLYAPEAKWTAKSLALHTQAVVQGAFILAKASDDVGVAVSQIEHLRLYVELLLKKPAKSKKAAA